MKNVFFNNKRIAILLLVVVTILTIFTITLIFKNKNSKKYQSKATYTEIVDVTNNINENIEVKNENQDVISEEINPEDTSWDEDAEETKVEKKEEIKKDNTVQYYLKINYIANVVTAYTKDSEGNYTTPVKAMVCSTGTATPHSGVYRMSSKYRWHMLNGGVYGQYCSRITGHILFHSVPYATNSPDTLKYVAYDKLGTKASAGCIRLTVADAMWVYSNCASGTYVEFYGSSDPGSLGKPSARKISSNEVCRNWDPTDPDSRNPWNNYVETRNTENEDINKKNNEQNNNTTNKENSTSENTVAQTNQPQEEENTVQNNTSDEKTNSTVNETSDKKINNTVDEIADEKTNNTTNSITDETTKDNRSELENNTQSNNVNEI